MFDDFKKHFQGLDSIQSVPFTLAILIIGTINVASGAMFLDRRTCLISKDADTLFNMQLASFVITAIFVGLLIYLKMSQEWLGTAVTFVIAGVLIATTVGALDYYRHPRCIDDDLRKKIVNLNILTNDEKRLIGISDTQMSEVSVGLFGTSVACSALLIAFSFYLIWLLIDKSKKPKAE